MYIFRICSLLDKLLNNGCVGQTTVFDADGLVVNDLVGKCGHQAERYDGVLRARNANVLSQIRDQSRKIYLNHHSVN